MARVGIDEVEEILEADADPGEGLVAACIAAAHEMMEEVFEDETGISTGLLKEIERWLSAHFVMVRERRKSSEKLGEASIAYDGNVGTGKMGLELTPYGQQAIALDTTGRLTATGVGKRATFKAVDLNL